MGACRWFRPPLSRGLPECSSRVVRGMYRSHALFDGVIFLTHSRNLCSDYIISFLFHTDGFIAVFFFLVSLFWLSTNDDCILTILPSTFQVLGNRLPLAPSIVCRHARQVRVRERRVLHRGFRTQLSDSQDIGMESNWCCRRWDLRGQTTHPRQLPVRWAWTVSASRRHCGIYRKELVAN